MVSTTIIIIPEELPLPCLYLLPSKRFKDRYQHQRRKYEFMEQDGIKETDIFKTIMFQTDDDEIVLFK
jgi:hypothetical protein